MKFLLLSLSAAFVLLPTLAQAKITIFSTTDAIRKTMNSPQLTELVKKAGEVDRIEVIERFDSSAPQAFELTVLSSLKSSTGTVPCVSTLHVMVVLDESAPRGITSSKMLDPVLTETVCAPTAR